LAYTVAAQARPEHSHAYNRWLAAVAQQAQLQGLGPKDFDNPNGLEALAAMVQVAQRLLPDAFPVCEDWRPAVEHAHKSLESMGLEVRR
jgi:hypothetical protein